MQSIIRQLTGQDKLGERPKRLIRLEGTARYAGLRLAPAGNKIAFHTNCAYFREFLVFISDLRDF